MIFNVLYITGHEIKERRDKVCIQAREDLVVALVLGLIRMEKDVIERVSKWI